MFMFCSIRCMCAASNDCHYFFIFHRMLTASECPDVKNYKWRLNPVWHRMLCSCTRMTTVGIIGRVKGLNDSLKTSLKSNDSRQGSWSPTSALNAQLVATSTTTKQQDSQRRRSVYFSRPRAGKVPPLLAAAAVYCLICVANKTTLRGVGDRRTSIQLAARTFALFRRSFVITRCSGATVDQIPAGRDGTLLFTTA